MKSIASSFLVVGATMTLIGAISYCTNWLYAPYVYLIGAILFAAGQIVSFPKNSSKNIRRLRSQQVLGAIILIFSAVLMLAAHGNEWIVCLAIASLFELYTAFRIPQEEKRED